MASYLTIAIKCLDNGTWKISGYSKQNHRAILINNENVGCLKGKKIVRVFPIGEIVDKKFKIRKKIISHNMIIQEEICVPKAVGEFYVNQKVLSSLNQRYTVIDAEERFVDLCMVNCENGKDMCFKSQRIEYDDKMMQSILRKNYEESVIADFISKIINGINLYRFTNQIPLGIILLSGEIFENQKLVERLRENLFDYQIYAYKPADAAVLGAAYHANRYIHSEETYIEEKRNTYINNRSYYYKLENSQKEGYETLLRGIFNRRENVCFRGKESDIYPIYQALRLDYPEIELIWDYRQSSYIKKTFVSSDCMIDMILKYKKNFETLLYKIENKVDQIIRKCIGSDSISDEELVKAVYKNLSEEYIYSKEKNRDGSYPDYAYTLEALLKNGVCRGYAVAMVFILKKLQIPVMYISGDAAGQEFGGHAWNLVQNIEGKYRHLDVTWDLGKPENKFNYFDLDDIQMRARRHFWDVQKFPKCS